MTVSSRSREETMVLGRRLGRRLEPGDVVALSGCLGSGKTTFTKGLAEGLGVEEPRWVTSPTFVLVHEYEGRVPIYHIDAYRLKGAADAEALGTDELFYGGGVAVVEWADRILGALPTDRLDILIEISGEEARRLTLKPSGKRYEELVAALDAAP